MQAQNQIFYRQNSLFALLIGGCFVVASHLCFITAGQIFNNAALNHTIHFLFITGLFMGIRQYRDSRYQQGFITYGKALLAGIWISFLCGLIYGLYTVCLYSLYPELLDSYLNIAREIIRQAYGDTPLQETISQLLTAFTTPISIGLSELFGTFASGVIFTLIIAAFLRKRPIEM